MALPLEQVVKQLEDSGIISSETLKDFVPPKASPKDGDELVHALVKSEKLTNFQGQQVKGGRAKSLKMGEYTILEKIGAGGMGQVFKARHRRMERTVAIKMLPPAMTKDAASAARFQREVVAAAKLSHPNIVAAYDAGQAGAAHFLVMEYVEGKDLSALVKQNGPFPVNKAVNYILQAARGLEFAHGEGVVHRDIKPANLLLDKKEVVKILDMGLARIEQSDSAQADLTGTGTIMGTVDYMAPEQARNTRHADARADIYSLGISLYYLLAGKAAYAGETLMDKLLAHREEPIPSLQEVQTTVSKKLEAVFNKMVAKKIEDRYQSMSEVIEALEGLGYGGSSTGRKGDVASTIDLSSADRKKLLSQAKKKPLGSITEVVASEKSKNLILKIVGGSFGTIVAPILVFYLIRHLDKQDHPANPPAATVPAATVQPVVVATNTPPQPPAHVVDDGSPKPMKAPFDAAQAKAGQIAWAKHLGTQVETTNSVGMRLTLIPPGEFLMGSTPEQNAVGRKMGQDDKLKPDDPYFGRLAGEMPQHKVTITQPFLMGSTEVTVAQFRKFVEATKYETEAEKYGFGNSGDKTIDKAKEADTGKNWKNPGYAITDDTAVTQITWNDAVAYCAWLSEQEQRRPWYRPDGKGGWLVAAHADGYRLPTEAEWESACRAGTTTQYSFGDDKAQLEQYGWINKNAGGKAQPVALKRPNPFGLFDIHGNSQEWCQDWYDGKWYEKSLPSDPNGSSSGTSRVLRGGYWNSNASISRSASRNYYSSSYHNPSIGFRCVRVADAAADSQLATNTTTQPTNPVTPATTQPNQPWNTPAFQQWVKATQALPAGQQAIAVNKKLVELNPGFDGKATPNLERGMVTGLDFITEHVTDISPVRALAGLQSLTCNAAQKGNARSELFELSPLVGMKLTKLECSNTEVFDLSPLHGMPLETLNVTGTKVTDLSPLHGLPLTTLSLSSTKVKDLSPLQGLPLASLILVSTPVTDLSPLKGMSSLTTLSCQQCKQLADFLPLTDCKALTLLKATTTKLTPAQVAALQKALPNCKIDWDEPAKAEDGKPKADGAWNMPAFQQWVKATQALPAEQQIEAVSKKLTELNPGFDGRVTGADGKGTPKVESGVVTELGLLTDKVTDVSPVRALAGLKTLNCNASVGAKGRFSDVSPLEGMPLTQFRCENTNVSDLSPLRGMNLTSLSCGGTNVSDLSPLLGMPLLFLNCGNSLVSDLSPLGGMNLVNLILTPKNIANGLDVIRQMKSLKIIGLRNDSQKFTAAEFWKKYDAGEFGKPGQPAAKPRLAYLDPAFQQWVKATQALPAEKQIEAVSKKLMELNEGFDGKVTGRDRKGTPKIENGVVTELCFRTGNVTDISPVRALARLNNLEINEDLGRKGKLSDLSPLKGMRLTKLAFQNTQASDLSPLEAMPLTSLEIGHTLVSDLSPLRGLKLTHLSFQSTKISDMSALVGMPLTSVLCYNNHQLSDISPLQECKSLDLLNVKATKVTPAQVAALQKALPNCKIDWDDPAKPKTPEPAAAGTK